MRGRRIRELLGGPEHRKLFAEARRRHEEAGEGPVRSFTLHNLAAAEREALAGLLGWVSVPEGPVRIRCRQLDNALRASAVDAGLVEVIEALGGPLRDLRAEREAVEQAEEEMWHAAREHPVVQRRPPLAAWLQDLRDLGLLKRSAKALGCGEEEVLKSALSVVERLPADGIPLSVLASETMGDAHGLDPGRPMGAIVIRAVTRLLARDAPPGDAVSRRLAWEAVGVLCDPLSVHVLVLGVRPLGRGRLARALTAASEEGEPQRITLRELERADLRWEEGDEVFVCENPSVVAAAADRLANRVAPLICVEGVPSTAALLLLRSLGDAGSRLRFRCDFDWMGLRIGQSLAALPGAVPWRFSTADYLESLASIREPAPLTGTPLSVTWDSALADQMASRAAAVYEEQLIERLLSDLACGRGHRRDEARLI